MLNRKKLTVLVSAEYQRATWTKRTLVQYSLYRWCSLNYLLHSNITKLHCRGEDRRKYGKVSRGKSCIDTNTHTHAFSLIFVLIQYLEKHHLFISVLTSFIKLHTNQIDSEFFLKNTEHVQMFTETFWIFAFLLNLITIAWHWVCVKFHILRRLTNVNLVLKVLNSTSASAFYIEWVLENILAFFNFFF